MGSKLINQSNHFIASYVASESEGKTNMHADRLGAWAHVQQMDRRIILQ